MKSYVMALVVLSIVLFILLVAACPTFDDRREAFETSAHQHVRCRWNQRIDECLCTVWAKSADTRGTGAITWVPSHVCEGLR